MIYFWATVLCAINLAWLAGTIFMLPGNWLMVATAAAFAWWQRDAGMMGVWPLVVAALLALVGEAIEFFASSLAVRSAGGTRWGAFGALMGAAAGLVVGTALIPVPVLGSLLGACVGAAAGSLGGELAAGRKSPGLWRPSLAAGAGRLIGTLAKFVIGVMIFLTIAVAAFWP